MGGFSCESKQRATYLCCNHGVPECQSHKVHPCSDCRLIHGEGETDGEFSFLSTSGPRQTFSRGVYQK